MEKHINSAGYDLYEVTPNEWVLHVKNGNIYHGSLEKVGLYAVKKLGFNIEDIEAAVEEMMKHDHNGAHFGSYKRFIHTFRKEFKNVIRAAS